MGYRPYAVSSHLVCRFTRKRPALSAQRHVRRRNTTDDGIQLQVAVVALLSGGMGAVSVLLIHCEVAVAY